MSSTICTVVTSDGEKIKFDEDDAKCMHACYCSSTDTKASKVATIILYTGTGAALGGLSLTPVGVGIGAGVGFTVAVVKIVIEEIIRYKNKTE